VPATRLQNIVLIIFETLLAGEIHDHAMHAANIIQTHFLSVFVIFKDIQNSDAAYHLAEFLSMRRERGGSRLKDNLRSKKADF